MVLDSQVRINSKSAYGLAVYHVLHCTPQSIESTLPDKELPGEPFAYEVKILIEVPLWMSALSAVISHDRFSGKLGKNRGGQNGNRGGMDGRRRRAG